VDADPCGAFNALQTNIVNWAKNPAFNFDETLSKHFPDATTPEDYISTATMNARAPTKNWLWLAFSDCRRTQGRYQDALQNLEWAAVDIKPKDQAFRELIVARAIALGEGADGASGADAVSYRSTRLGQMIGKRKGSEWLKKAYGEAKAERDSALNKPRGSQDATATQGANKEGGADQPARTQINPLPKTNRYGTDWIKLKDLSYYKALLEVEPKTQEVLKSAENKEPLFFSAFSIWDQAPAVVAGPETRYLVTLVQQSDVKDLTAVPTRFRASREYAAMVTSSGFERANFALGHLMARRALEVGCPQAGLDQIKDVVAHDFNPNGAADPSKLTPEAKSFNDLVAAALKKSAEQSKGAEPCGVK
jgi:hypothetical protein